MARKRKERSLGEMISSICFYGVGLYFLLEGSLARDEGAPLHIFLGLWLSGAVCVLGGARFIIADFIEKLQARRQ
jgi:hypothetical protein